MCCVSAGGSALAAKGGHSLGHSSGLDTIFSDVDDLDDDVGLVDAEVLEMLLNR